MSFLDKIKEFFNFEKEEEIDEENINEEEIKIKKEFTSKNETKQKEIQLLAEKAFEAKMSGNYKKALKLWDDFSSEFPEAKAQAKARKAKLYIILDNKEKAKDELLSFFKWYSEKGSFDYSSGYFTVFISALQDLGFYTKEWSDEDDYIKNISGKDISLDKNLTMERIAEGLDYLKDNDIWSSSLEEVEKNLGILS
ncbi:MAG: hypothetical protein ACOCRX_09755 [Candidatus Woesearchaeota archaeon]